ncbi:hypothetical protein, partial [Candidatus Methylomirabilis sp.]|uniref:hypothetical protein n=1 Tax=Candidatus Methylomirabilis sp. TaxID=2032687 RepID=UPI003C70E966
MLTGRGTSGVCPPTHPSPSEGGGAGRGGGTKSSSSKSIRVEQSSQQLEALNDPGSRTTDRVRIDRS